MFKKLILIFSICAIVSSVFGLGPIVVAHGNWMDLVIHPHFWTFYIKSFLWFFSASVVACVLVAVAVSRNPSYSDKANRRNEKAY